MSQGKALSIPANDHDNHGGKTELAADQAATLQRCPLSHFTDRRIEITPTSRLIPYRNRARCAAITRPLTRTRRCKLGR